MPLLEYIPKKYVRVVRFLIAGGFSTGMTVGTLFILNSVFHVWYVSASVVAFLVGFFISFLLQKFWTFQDGAMHRVGKQLLMYLVLALINLGFNTLLIYCFVDFFGLIPVVAQLLTSALIACESFFLYRFVIFSSLHEADSRVI